MKKMAFHCMFEQSGTFKNEFKKLGYQAYDYDILNDFGETDYIIDLFSEIEKSYRGDSSIFDKISRDDYVLAFFPCVRFENQILLWFLGNERNLKNKSDKEKLEKNLELHKELHEMYCLITKLVIVCINKGLKLIIENPYSTQHYLTRYWAIKPKVIDEDRTKMGDYFKKPTQYWFINCEPQYNFIFEAYDVKPKKRVSYGCNKVERSMISKEYANRFIREFIIEEGEKSEETTLL